MCVCVQPWPGGLWVGGTFPVGSVAYVTLHCNYLAKNCSPQWNLFGDWNALCCLALGASLSSSLRHMTILLYRLMCVYIYSPIKACLFSILKRVLSMHFCFTIPGYKFREDIFHFHPFAYHFLSTPPLMMGCCWPHLPSPTNYYLTLAGIIAYLYIYIYSINFCCDVLSSDSIARRKHFIP